MKKEVAKITKAQAKVIDKIVKEGCEESIVKNRIARPVKWVTTFTEPLASLDLDTLIRALYSGYEIESTPEEKLLELWNHYDPEKSNDDGDRGVRLGIRETLAIYNIKVPEVNCTSEDICIAENDLSEIPKFEMTFEPAFESEESSGNGKGITQTEPELDWIETKGEK